LKVKKNLGNSKLKIIHTSDWHLGQNFMGKSRAEEHRAFLSWLIDLIREKKIEVLLVSGDIFDTGTPPNYALELYYNFLKQLSLIKTLNTTIITAGNHDSVSTLKAPKELLKALNVHVITTGEKDEDVIIPMGEDTKAIVCAVPYLRDSVIRQSLSGETVSDKEKLASQKISIDSLFLDEGFGTLDSDSLELALNALNQLQSSGKMVGVISHVEALKERIPLQIKVEPKGDGTSGLSLF
jgi:DNA repair exonuclease SbcCD nuclease subunit